MKYGCTSGLGKLNLTLIYILPFERTIPVQKSKVLPHVRCHLSWQQRDKSRPIYFVHLSMLQRQSKGYQYTSFIHFIRVIFHPYDTRRDLCLWNVCLSVVHKFYWNREVCFSTSSIWAKITDGQTAERER